MAEEAPKQITLTGAKGALKLSLSPPASLALRYEVTYAVVESEPRAVAAALGLCSPAVRKHVPYDHGSVLQYGQRVLDWLLSEGVTWFDALNAGRIAWRHCSRGVVSEREVAETEGFFAPTEAASTGS